MKAAPTGRPFLRRESFGRQVGWRTLRVFRVRVFSASSAYSTPLFSFSYANPVRMTPRGQILLVLKKYVKDLTKY